MCNSRLIHIFLITLAMFCFFGAPSALATPIAVSYDVTDVDGNQALPLYMLRLDEFFPGTDEVTFGEMGVILDIFTDGTARLHGMVEVAEVNDSGGPGGFASQWILDVAFDPAGTPGPDPLLTYFDLNPLGMELVNKANPMDFANFFERPADGSKPFEVGVGALKDDKCVANPPKCLSAEGWLGWEHIVNGQKVAEYDDATADFLMELDPRNPIPEPSAALLFGVGSLVVGRSIRRKNR